MKEQAIEKLCKELGEFKGGQKEQAVSKYVANTLKSFCLQDEEFAQAVVQSGKTLSDCCTEIMKDTKNYISDNEVYRRAAQFYFPGSDIIFSMKINLSASAEKAINLSLDDLLDL